MNCLLKLLAVCIFDPSGVYVTAGLEGQLNHPSDERIVRSCYVNSWCMGRRNSGAVGTLKLGAVTTLLETSKLGRLTLDYGLEHRSLVDTNRDRGQELAFAEVTWRPFK